MDKKQNLKSQIIKMKAKFATLDQSCQNLPPKNKALKEHILKMKANYEAELTKVKVEHAQETVAKFMFFKEFENILVS